MSHLDLVTSRMSPASRRSRRRLGLAGAAMSLALAGCGTNHIVSNDWKAPSDYRNRHPIVLADKSRTLDLFVGTNSGRLDPRQSEDLQSFVREFHERGKGAMLAFVPVGSLTPGADAHGMAVVRAALGAHRVPVAIRSYAVDDPSLAAPIRLSFAELTASVPHRCGQWPSDLSGPNSLEGIENEQYWNFGCAYQQNIAAQVADPVDLVRPQAESRIDVVKRSNEITKLRQGQDPATSYNFKNKATIGTVGVAADERPVRHQQTGSRQRRGAARGPYPAAAAHLAASVLQTPELASVLQTAAADRRMTKVHVKVQTVALRRPSRPIPRPRRPTSSPSNRSATGPR